MMRGFTLLEILIAIAIGTMTIVLVTAFTLDISDFGLDLSERLENERALELTLRVMLTEIRSMGPGENGAYPVAAASSTSFSFYADADGDGDFDLLRYFLSGTTLRRGIINPTGTSPVTYPTASEVVADVAFNLRNAVVFEYFAEGYPDEIGPLPGPVDVADIRMVHVVGTVDSNPAEPPLPATSEIHATIRNLRGEI